MSNANKYNIPPGYSFLQSMIHSPEFLRDPIKFISKNMITFSGTYSASLGSTRKLILTQNPDFINHVLKENHKNYHKSELSTKRAVEFFGKGLLFSNGDYWLRQRRLIQPAFHREKLQRLFEIMIRSINESLLNFPSGENIDIYPAVHQVSFNILIRSLFDIKLSTQITDELSGIFTDLQNFLITDINQPFRKLFYPFTGAEKVQLRKAKRLREICMNIIAERKQSNKEYNDLLDLLMKSTYEDSGEHMSDDQIIDELLILIFAGHETTANSLSWLLYLLSTNQEVLNKLTASLEGSTTEQSQNNEYLKATINEAMRLYPAAWMTERVALQDDQFDTFSFPKGTIIIPFFFGLHRDNNLWSDGSDFRPERFIEDPKVGRSKNYFPFGAGPRMCIGNNFAAAEMAFFTFLFLKKFRITPTGQVPQKKALITLRPDAVLLNIQHADSKS